MLRDRHGVSASRRVGECIYLASCLSTSTQRGVAMVFIALREHRESVVNVIDIPPGIAYMAVDNVDERDRTDPDSDYQSEVLLPPGTILRVDQVSDHHVYYTVQPYRPQIMLEFVNLFKGLRSLEVSLGSIESLIVGGGGYLHSTNYKS